MIDRLNFWRSVDESTPKDSLVFARRRANNDDRIYLGKFNHAGMFEGACISTRDTIVAPQEVLWWRFMPEKVYMQATNINWHNINEQVPPNNLQLLILYTQKYLSPYCDPIKIQIVRSCYYSWSTGFQTDGFFMNQPQYVEQVTHWAYMPELPPQKD